MLGAAKGRSIIGIDCDCRHTARSCTGQDLLPNNLLATGDQ